MKLNYVELILENCDSIKINGNDIGIFYLDNVKECITKIGTRDRRDVIREKSVETFAIEISKRANKESSYLSDEKDTDKYMIFDRLTHPDITYVKFELENDSTFEVEQYFVPWNEKDEYNNNLQKSYISKNGHLYIVISKDQQIEDIFNMDRINKENYSNFLFDNV